uniref:Uncharacterized protein n=1 Tax=Cacopsylla melanoneura TaxID=428564 RepID=A0A8D8PVN3_9HEMI
MNLQQYCSAITDGIQKNLNGEKIIIKFSCEIQKSGIIGIKLRASLYLFILDFFRRYLCHFNVYYLHPQQGPVFFAPVTPLSATRPDTPHFPSGVHCLCT